MSAVAAHGHRATAASSSSSPNPTPEYITPPVPSESHLWYGGAHQQGLRSALTNEHEHMTVHEHEHGDQTTDMTLFTASMTGNLAVLQELLRTHDPNITQPSTGLSALHYASSRGYIQLVDYLLDKAGANVDLEDREGEACV
jgi:Ankyrin repeats (3 copies)